jgi:ribosomal-protein-alanine N-acetyltransferase
MIETPRLVLRELTPADLDAVAEMLGDAEVMRYFPKPLSREESEAWIGRWRACYARDGFGYWLAVEKTTERPVGQAGLLMQEIDGVAEPGLGYIIHRPYWRRGLALEAAAATREWAFEVRRYRRVICTVRPENEPSLGVARKLGLREERWILYQGYEHVLFAGERG